MPNPSSNGAISISCIECTQPIGTFLLGAIEASDLAAISFADVRRPDGRDIERYIGTQRDLSEARVAEIRQYVTTVDASFPTSVILAISSADASGAFPKPNDLIGFPRILATIPSLVSHKFEGALFPVELADGIASMSSYPSGRILQRFMEDNHRSSP